MTPDAGELMALRKRLADEITLFSKDKHMLLKLIDDRIAASQPDREAVARAVGDVVERCAKIAEPWPGFILDDSSTDADRAVVAVRTEIATKIRSLAV
ncbi:TPA: hypothetical protein O5T74_002607, partial [Staphylococcus aureus]|nr:hypothetical protein [Staphylococcus aureus]